MRYNLKKIHAKEKQKTEAIRKHLKRIQGVFNVIECGRTGL